MVHGRKVYPFYIHPDSVYRQQIGPRAGRSVFVFKAYDFSYSALFPYLLQQFPLLIKRYRHIIEDGFPQPVWVPQQGIFNRQGHFHLSVSDFLLCLYFFSVFRGKRRFNRKNTRLRYSGCNQEAAVSLFIPLSPDEQILRFRPVNTGQRYVPPDTKIHQTGSKIPLIAKAALLGKSLACFPNLPRLIRRVFYKNLKRNRFLFFINLCQIQRKGFKHPLMAAQEAVIPIDHTRIVHAGKIQPDFCPCHLWSQKGRLVEPPFIFYPFAFEAVHSVIRVFYVSGPI